MVLKPSLADVMQQLLHLRDFNHAGAAKCIQRIVSKATFTAVATHLTRQIIGREPRETHCPWLDQADNGSKRILLANRAGNNFLKIHLERTEEMLRQVRAMEADCLIRIASVIVVPVKQRRGSS